MTAGKENHYDKIKAIRLILIIGFVIVTIKFIAYAYTDSTAILSDALESIINIIASGFALYSIYYSARHKDEDHPYGHGKMEYVAVGFEGALIFLTGIIIIIESIIKLFEKHVVQQVDIGLLLTLLSSLILLGMGLFLKQKGKKLKSEVLIADGKHLITDVVTSVGIIIGLIAYRFTGWYWIDSTIAMVLALHIIFSGYELIRQSLDTLLDKADMDTIENVASILQKNRKSNWIDVHNMRLQKFGSQMHIDCHMTMPFYESLESIHNNINEVEQILNSELHNTVELFIHVDPCDKKPCSICKVTECRFREQNFSHEITWSSANLIINKRHSG